MQKIIGKYLCTENTIFKNEDELAGLDPGSIAGRVCSPSGRTWLADAMAYAHLIDGEGRLYDTRISYTDRDGFFLLDSMPAGHTYTVYVQFGDEILETHTVNVDEREEVAINVRSEVRALRDLSRGYRWIHAQREPAIQSQLLSLSRSSEFRP